MKKLLFIIAILFTTALSFAQVSVRGYYRSNGTYVQPHQRTSPNSTRNDNYSTVGNTNPYTGKAGTVARDSYSGTNSTSSYSTLAYKTTYSAPTYSAPTHNTTTYSAPASYLAPSYSSSNTIYTGSKGGTYYINSNGNKSYVSQN